MYNRRSIAQEFADKIKSEDIEKIILYGSVAWGENTEESDIDILIVSKKVREIESDINNEVVNTVLNTRQLISSYNVCATF